MHMYQRDRQLDLNASRPRDVRHRLLRHACEPLEARRLLAASIQPDGTLLVDGTSGNDQIQVFTSAGNAVTVTLNGDPSEFQRSQFTKLLVRGFDGTDVINVIDSSPSIPTTIQAGDGVDIIDLIDSSASVNGGLGNDEYIIRGQAQLTGFSDPGGIDALNIGSSSLTGPVDMNNYPTLENVHSAKGEVIGNDLDNLFTALSTVTLRGMGGNDTLHGGDGSDLLLGGGGDDLIEGGSGNDTIDGGTGADVMKGGGGLDTVTYATRIAGVTVGLGTIADDGEANEHDNAFNDIENIIGGSGNDSLKGTAANNLLVGNSGNDTLRGFEGNDTLSGNAGTDLLDGGLGFDAANNSTGDSLISIEEFGGDDIQPTATITAARTLHVRGSAGNDNILLVGASGQVKVFLNGPGGSFLTFADQNFDRILLEGVGGDDRLDANNSNLLANPLTIDGGGGRDTLIGSNGNDRLLGGSGFDSLEGGGGNDTLDGGTNGDVMKGGAGNDTVDYSSRTTKLIIGIGTLGDDGEAGEKDNVYLDIETVLGGSGDDSIKGSGANNLLVGNGGNDSISGNYGNDTLQGGAGNDTLVGEGGTDVLDGGSGTNMLIQ